MYPIVAWVGGIVFVPLLVIALVRMPPVRAFVLATSFTIGAMGGFLAGLLLGDPIFGPLGGDGANLSWLILFASLAAIGGGVLAVYLLGKVSGKSLWRRT